MNSKHALRIAADWCVGPRLQEAVLHAWSRIASPILKENVALRGRHAGERRCFVIGNGPSLKGMDLKLLAEEYTIAANSFYKHPDARLIGLDYLCINDPHFMTDEPRTVAWHRTIAEKLPHTRMLLNESAHPLVERHHLYPGQDVHYVKIGRSTRYASSINIDLSKPLNVGVTTGSSLAIPLALSLGFREICLIGFDCNWLADTSASYHFYQTHEFFPEFDSVVADNRGFKYEDELRTSLGEFESHRLLRQKAEQIGVRIVNATAGGLLDVYPRTAYADLVAAKTGQSPGLA